MRSNILTLLVFIAVGTSATVATAAHRDPVASRCTVQKLRPLAKEVWNTEHWKRGTPSEATLEAYHSRLECAPRAHKEAMKNVWQAEQKKYFLYRHGEEFRIKITPFYCNGDWWATECDIPLHESGYGSGGGNLYGMLDAWYVHGCTAFAPSAWDASKYYQDICAHRHWMEYGRGGWPSY